mgnify:CR=1 FL=1
MPLRVGSYAAVPLYVAVIHSSGARTHGSAPKLEAGEERSDIVTRTLDSSAEKAAGALNRGLWSKLASQSAIRSPWLWGAVGATDAPLAHASLRDDSSDSIHLQGRVVP